MSILDNDTLALTLGRIVQAAAFMEMETRKVFLTFLKGNPSFHIERKSLPISTVVKWVCEMLPYAELSDDQQALAKRVMVNVQAAADERNRCVHDLWYPLDTDVWYRMRWEGLMSNSNALVSQTSDDLNHVLNQIDAVNEQLNQLVNCLIGVLENWTINIEGVDHEWSTLQTKLDTPVQRSGWRKQQDNLLRPGAPPVQP